VRSRLARGAGLDRRGQGWGGKVPAAAAAAPVLYLAGLLLLPEPLPLRGAGDGVLAARLDARAGARRRSTTFFILRLHHTHTPTQAVCVFAEGQTSRSHGRGRPQVEKGGARTRKASVHARTFQKRR
jgi:hypothetical protein